MTELWLMRHGEAQSLQDDPSLTDAGRRKIEELVKQVTQLGIVSRIFHSGKRRAMETAQLVQHHGAPHAALVFMPGIKPNDNIDDIIPSLDALTSPALLVSHLPFLPALLHHLCAGQAALPQFNPGTMVQLDYQPGRCRMLAHYHTG